MNDPETPCLLFRKFTPDDLHALAAIRADAEVMRHTTGRPESVQEVQVWLDERMAYWTNHGFGRWALIDKATSALAGWCGLSYLEHTTEVEIGYGLAKDY